MIIFPDIDAIFGNCGKKLSYHDCITLPELFETLRRAISVLNEKGGSKNRRTKAIEPYYLSEILDYKSWLDEHVNTFHNISRPHVFR